MDQSPLFLFVTFEADEVRNGLKRWNWLSFKKVKRQNTSETYFGINNWTVTEERKPNKGAYSDKLLLSHIWQKVNEAVSDQTFNICFKFSPIRSLKVKLVYFVKTIFGYGFWSVALFWFFKVQGYLFLKGLNSYLENQNRATKDLVGQWHFWVKFEVFTNFLSTVET